MMTSTRMASSTPKALSSHATMLNWMKSVIRAAQPYWDLGITWNNHQKAGKTSKSTLKMIKILSKRI